MGENKNSYKKSYKGFVAWLIGCMLLSLSTALLPISSEHVIMAIVTNLMTIGIFLLSVIIYKTESVYWYSGTSYQDALEAGSEKRREFAKKHMKRFGALALCYPGYSLLSLLLSLPSELDFAIAFFSVIATTLSTVRLKLQ